MLIGTILSELNFSHEYILSLGIPKLQVLYLEAMRQRTNKAFMLMELLTAHKIAKDSDRRTLLEGYKAHTQPYKYKKAVPQEQIDGSWNTLRLRG